MSIRDVVIVGGGPAGLHGRLGSPGPVHVSLFEEHADHRRAGALHRRAGARRVRRLRSRPDAVLNELTTVRFFAPSGEMVEYSTPTVEAVVIDRPVFDRELAARGDPRRRDASHGARDGGDSRSRWGHGDGRAR